MIVRTPSVLAAASTTDAERRVFAKIGWRLMPILILAYIFNYLDRNNVGFAGLTMNQAIGLTATDSGSERASSSSATACSRFQATSRFIASGRASGSRAS